MANLEPEAFKNLQDMDLQRMNIPDDDRRKLLNKLARIKESGTLDLEGLRYMI
jgi:hypothetical protein